MLKMKFITIIVVFCLLVFTTCATGGSTSSGTVSLDEALTAAAQELSSNVSGKTEIVIAAIKAPDNRTADFLTAELTSYLMKTGSFTVLERGNALAAVDAEQAFQMSGLVSDESAVGIGHYLGAKVVISGTFDPYAGFNQFRLRAVDVSSSQLLAMPSSRINPRDRVIANVMPKQTKAQKIQEQVLTHFNRGKDLFREGKRDEALREFDQAIALDKKLAEAYFYRGLIFDIKQEYDRAIAEYTQAIRINRNYANAYLERGLTYSARSFTYFREDDIYRANLDIDHAIVDFSQAIQINPNDMWAYVFRGNNNNYYEYYDRAIADYTQAIRINPHLDLAYEQRGDVYVNRGDKYMDEEDYDRAIADYTQVIRINTSPNLYHTYSKRADLYMVKGDYDRAIADFTQMIRIYPDAADPYYDRGIAYHEKDDLDKAIADYTQAIRLNPNFIEAYNNRGYIYYIKRDYNRAITDYEAALRIDPYFDGIDIIRNNLDEAKEARGW